MSLRISPEGQQQIYSSSSSSPSCSQEGDLSGSSPELLSHSTPEIPALNLEFSMLRRRSLSASDSGSPTSDAPASGSLSARDSERQRTDTLVARSLTFQPTECPSTGKRRKRPTPPRTLKSSVQKNRELTPRVLLSHSFGLDRISHELRSIEPRQSSSGGGSSPQMSRVKPADYSLYLSVASKLHAEELQTRPTEHDFPLLAKLAKSPDQSYSCNPSLIAEEIQHVARRPGGDILLAVCHQVSQHHREKWMSIAKCLFVYPEGVKFLRAYLGLYEQDIPKFAKHLMISLRGDDVDHLEIIASLTIMSQNDMADISLPFCKEYLFQLLQSELVELRSQLKKIPLQEQNDPINKALDYLYTLSLPNECCQLLGVRREQLLQQGWEKKVASFLLLDVFGSKALSLKNLSPRRKKFFRSIKERVRALISGSVSDRYLEVHRDFISRHAKCMEDSIDPGAHAWLTGNLEKMHIHFANHFHQRSEQCSSPVISTRAVLESECSIASPRTVVENPLLKKVNLECLAPLESVRVPYDHMQMVMAFIPNVRLGVGIQRLLIKQLHAMKERNPGNIELEFRESLFLAGLMLDPEGCAFVKRFFEASKENEHYNIDAFVKSATHYYLDSGFSVETVLELLKSITNIVLETEQKESVLRGVNLSSLFYREFVTQFWGSQLSDYVEKIEQLRVEVFSGSAEEAVKLGDFLRAAISRLHQLSLPEALKRLLHERVEILQDWIGTKDAVCQAQILVGTELILRIVNPSLLQRDRHPHVIRLTKILQKLANQTPFDGLDQGEHPELNAAIYDQFVNEHLAFTHRTQTASSSSTSSSSS